jgi:cell division protein FtsL
MMTTLADIFSKVAVTLVTAAVLGSFGFIIKMSGDIEDLERVHARYEQAMSSDTRQVEKMERQIEDLQHDVRALMIAVGKNEREIERAQRPSPQPAF